MTTLGHTVEYWAMRRTAPGFEDTADLLRERVRANAERLRAATAQLAATRREAELTRVRAEALREEIQHTLDVLNAGLTTLREMPRPAVEPVLPVLPRFTMRPEDPVDAVRRELHDAYADSRDPALRAELAATYDGFARSLALKFRHRESVEDLVQVARVGLLNAIDRFDPALGRPFPLFARITITGELKRHMRDKTWGMRVPRSLQEDYLNVMRAVDELTGEQSDSPSMEAVADRCEISVDRVLEAMELRVSQRALSIDAPAADGQEEPLIELGQEEAGFRRLENRELLDQLLGRLPERDRRIVELRFVNELTQSEIAEEVGVSQMCVSRVLARTLGHLRLWARHAVN